jgi:hypothetical protein
MNVKRGRRLLSLLSCLAAASACGKRLDAAECERMLDRYVELLARDDRPDSSPDELFRLQQEARKKARRDPAFHACAERVSRSAYECAMQAPNADKLEQCLL